MHEDDYKKHMNILLDFVYKNDLKLKVEQEYYESEIFPPNTIFRITDFDNKVLMEVHADYDTVSGIFVAGKVFNTEPLQYFTEEHYECLETALEIVK